jgi:hypothetical protein
MSNTFHHLVWNAIKLAAITAIVVLQCSKAAYAFDDQRKGFVLGIGLGISPVANWSRTNGEPEESWHDSSAGGALQALAGYGFSEQNMVVLEVNSSAAKSERDRALDATYIGPVWYRYFGQTSRSWFIAVGVGGLALSYHDRDCEEIADCDKDNAIGLAFNLGVGNEFHKHWHATLSLTAGSAEDWFWGDDRLEVTTAKLVVSYIIY